ncbi:hypothetical protein [Pedobacter sandarakinus]|uniref:hypothetical protein n=1 Tax=Pedobacter sandarakinus TaxID=353156 RepID=UPI002246E2C5|nr:hypothetical protein [Pedobacter sandarakinus]MCX2574170.1 hypothetical protein [Pedobacter sandarakinus]
MRIVHTRKGILFALLLCTLHTVSAQKPWNTALVQQKKDGSLTYVADELGNVIPDFSRVGYHQNRKPIPVVPIVATISATGNQDQERIQHVIDELAKVPVNKDGLRGAILLKKGTYKIPGSINIPASGIILRGEGVETVLVATGKGQRKTIIASGKGNRTEVPGSRLKITDRYVPVGAKSFNLTTTKGLKVGDKIIVFRPGTVKWIADLKMDQIENKEGLVQWKPEAYNLEFERTITSIKGNQVGIDNPIVMAMETQYGGGEVYRYNFDGRINEVGIENMLLTSEYNGDTDEDHGWDAISFNRIENSWVSGVTSKYFGYSSVNLGGFSKQITVKDCRSLSPKSQIIGGRRYSFNNDGQLNLVMNCYASEGRHDYVTGAKVAGPNVFFNCKSENAKADIGPHHRWAVGTLFDNIVTDGEINIQDRGNWGTGHGWAGANQVLWNCTASKVAIQNPYVSAKNYAFGLIATLYDGRLPGRPKGIVEGLNKPGLVPKSLYLKQLELNRK